MQATIFTHSALKVGGEGCGGLRKYFWLISSRLDRGQCDIWCQASPSGDDYQTTQAKVVSAGLMYINPAQTHRSIWFLIQVGAWFMG